ncbi:TIGR03067 domain-containing protein [Singulisphaera sp. Ch08]|uniref:TIGR03067 domain-containing protein n=1 Tax=Singulisphaera sp. Ch08 TaxID=3120278 RepID=A0AAU7CCT1_9BACT
MSSKPTSVNSAQMPQEKPDADSPMAFPAPHPRTSDAIKGNSDQDLERLQGTWRSIAMVFDGRRIPPAALEHRRIIVIDDKFAVVDKDRTLRRGTLQINATTTPRQIDTLPADGPNTGKINQGIYELANDILRICWAPPGEPRPTNFSSEPGSKQWTVTDQKETSDMMAELSRVIAVTCESPGCPGVHQSRVHHRDFPELYGEGETPYDAALILLKHLLTESGMIADGWHHEILDQVIAEVRSFVDRVS